MTAHRRKMDLELRRILHGRVCAKMAPTQTVARQGGRGRHQPHPLARDKRLGAFGVRPVHPLQATPIATALSKNRAVRGQRGVLHYNIGKISIGLHENARRRRVRARIIALQWHFRNAGRTLR